MRVFYRGQRALITQHAFEAVCVGRRRYAIGNLSDVCIVRHDPERDSSGRVMGLSALVAAFLILPIVGPVSNVVAGLATGVFVIGGVLNMRRRPPLRWTLVATYEGRSVMLFESGDQTEFDQVCRGLRRALEQRDAR